MHLQGGVCHKTWLFSVSTKGKKQPEFKSQHFMGCLPFLQNCVCCYGLRDAAYVFIFCGLEVGDGCEKMLGKKEQQPFSPPVSCTECEQDKPLFVSVFQKRIDFQ